MRALHNVIWYWLRKKKRGRYGGDVIKCVVVLLWSRPDSSQDATTPSVRQFHKQEKTRGTF